MNASGSNSLRVDAVFVPAHRTAPADWTHGEIMVVADRVAGRRSGLVDEQAADVAAV